MIFGDLSSGNYTFKIVAKDSSGETKTFEKSFVVVAKSKPQSTPKPTATPIPTQSTVTNSIEYTSSRSALQIDPWTYPSGTLERGKSFKLKGRIKSDSHLTYVRSYMLDANKNVIMTGSGSTTSKTYVIEGYGLDKGMKFGQLSPGTYYLRYYAEDANGGRATWTSPAFYVK